MKKDKEYFINWLEKIAQKIALIKESQKNYELYTQKNIEEKIELFKSHFKYWVRYNYEFSLVINLSAIIENRSFRYADDLNFPKFLNEFSIFYNAHKEELMDTLINDKPQYFTDFNHPEIKVPLDDNDLIEQERIKTIKNIFDSLDIPKDIEDLNKLFLKLKTMRDKNFAHFTSFDKEINLTHKDLDIIATKVIEIFDNYAFILKNTTYCF